jgi:hypothetical protein
MATKANKKSLKPTTKNTSKTKSAEPKPAPIANVAGTKSKEAQMEVITQAQKEVAGKSR